MEESGKKSAVRLVSVQSGQDGQRLDNFLIGQLGGAPRSLAYKLIRTGQVRVNSGRAKAATRLAAGDKVRIPPVQLQEAAVVAIPEYALDLVVKAILFEDADHLVIDKPAGMAVHGGSGIKWGVIDVLRQLRPGQDIELVHRLDRDTSGCLVLARNKKAMRELQRQFRESVAEKRYLCLVNGRLPEARIVVNEPLFKTERGGERFMTVDPRGKHALTEFRLLEHHGEASFVEVHLMTGRTHQIRAHAAFMGHSLAGDTRYGTPQQAKYWRNFGLKRLFLHAHALTVLDSQGNSLAFTAPLPPELRAVLDSV